MAGDSLRIEKRTPDKPEVLAIATVLGISLGDAFLACFRVWAWADSFTNNGRIMRVTDTAIDSLTHVPGFAHALIEVGWLRVRSGALEFPNFARHMGRQKDQCSIDLATPTALFDVSAQESREREKDREEKSPPIPPPKEETEKEKEKRALGRGDPGGNLAQPSRARRPFVKPALEEVAAYCRERGNRVNPVAFLAHYESNGWQVGRNAMKDWRAAVRTWEQREGAFSNGRPGKPSGPPETPEERAARLDRLAREREESRAAAAPPEQVREMLDRMRRPPAAGRP